MVTKTMENNIEHFIEETGSWMCEGESKEREGYALEVMQVPKEQKSL